MNRLLRWWLMFCLILLASAGLAVMRFDQQLLRADVTRLSFFIYGLFMFANLRLYYGLRTNRFASAVSSAWLVVRISPIFGMIGTVIGFIIMLLGAFTDLDVSNTASMKQALTTMAIGMGSALWTTLTGLICSVALRIELFLLGVDDA